MLKEPGTDDCGFTAYDTSAWANDHSPLPLSNYYGYYRPTTTPLLLDASSHQQQLPQASDTPLTYDKLTSILTPLTKRRRGYDAQTKKGSRFHHGLQRDSGRLHEVLSKMDREILHITIPAFPIALARVIHSHLRGRPVAVAPLNSERALLQCISAEAASEGVFSGIPI